MLQAIAILGGWLLMMGQHDRSESLFYYFRIEDQVPQNHLLPVYDIYRIESFATLTRSGLHHQPSDSDSVEEEWVFSNLASLFLLRPCGAVAQDNSRYRFRRWRVAGLPDNRRALLRRRGSLRRAHGMRCLRPRWRP